MARQTVVRVKHKAAIHDSGTKFYEVFLFENDFGGFFITRYGKIAQQETGGQESFDAATPTNAESSFESKLRQKFSTKGGYVHDIRWEKSAMGAALRCPMSDDFSRMFRADNPGEFKTLRDAVLQIFNNDAVFQQLCDALDLPGAGDIEMIPVPVFEEVPEEVRAADESWGAW